VSEEGITKLLDELTVATEESVRPDLAEDLRRQIPHSFGAHKGGMNTINIVINLRINKLTAAAAIIITMIFTGAIFVGGSTPGSIYQDGKLLVRHYLEVDDRDGSDELAGMSRLYDYLISQGKDVAYYGSSIDPGRSSNAVLMQWKVADNEYKVILVNRGTLSLKTVNAEQLIELQRRMLNTKPE
jgi:hypothetical protein